MPRVPCVLCSAARRSALSLSARPLQSHQQRSSSSRPAYRAADAASSSHPTALDESGRLLQRSPIFDIPSTGPDGLPLSVRKWRRAQRTGAVSGDASLASSRIEDGFKRSRDDSVSNDGSGNLVEDPIRPPTLYTRRKALKASRRVPTNVWDFLIRLVPKIVTPSLPPHYPPSPYTPNADSSNNTAHPPSRSDTHFILCPSNILHNPSPPAPSTFKGRGVWVQCHRSTIAQLSHKGPHLGPLGRFPPPDQSSASTTAPLSSGARAGSPIGKSGLSTTKGGTIGPGLFVPPYLAEQVYEQLCERVLQEMARLASRPGLRRSNASDRGLGRGAQEKVVPDGRGRDPKWGLLRLLDPTEGKFWAGSSQKARQGRHEASEPAVGSDGAARNSLVQPTVAGILDTAGLNTLLPPTPPALNPELRPGDAAHCRGPKSGTPTLPGLVYPPLSVHPPPSPSHAPTSEGDASSTPKSDPIPIPTFHLASLFPATHHATLAGHLDRLVSCSNADDQAGDGETTTSDLGSGTSKQDITQDTPSGLIAVQIVTPQYGTSSDMNRVVDSTAGRNKRSAGEVQSESKGSLAGTGAGDKGDVRGLDLVKALWRLKLWSGQGWGEQS